MNSARESKVGVPENFGFVGFEARGHKPIRFRGARVVGLPEGLQATVRALRLGDGGTVIGALTGDLDREEPRRFNFRPVRDVSLNPEQEDWYLVVTAVPTRTGHFKTEGLEVDWEAGGHRGTAVYRYRIEVDAPG